MPVEVEIDYLVVGAGASGMAFADTLLSETDATMAIVDRQTRPGGHWTMAYPFVRLHQPSAFYGVGSRELGTGRRDRTGANAGLHELATADEILAYYEQVMGTVFLPSGRVSYVPRASYEGVDGADSRRHRIRLLDSDEEWTLVVRRRIVDTTHQDVTVPAMSPPAYDVDPGVALVTPNDLPDVEPPPGGYAVIGAGKTAIDVCLWLLGQGIDADRITWVVPRDPWLLNRAHLQPGGEFDDLKKAATEERVRAVLDCSSLGDLFDRLEAAGVLLRAFPDGVPNTFRCATVTRAEIEELRRIGRIVRHGRVRRCEPTALVFDDVTTPLAPGTLLVDCTGDGLPCRPASAVFDGSRITVQPVLPCQQVASAALIAHLEATDTSDDHKNHLCPPSPYPASALDWIRFQIASDDLMARWSEDPDLVAWVQSCRLTGLAVAPSTMSEDDSRRLLENLHRERDRLAGFTT